MSNLWHPAVWPLPNVWLGTSVENQQYAELRIPHLLAAPAAVRFVSCEPLLDPVDLTPWLRPMPGCGHVDGEDGTCRHPDRSTPECNVGVNCPVTEDWHGIDWVIAGGESGPNARAVHPWWVRDLRDHCVGAGVPFFFKQWGAWRPVAHGEMPRRVRTFYGDPTIDPPVSMVRTDKRSAGRELDGRTWDEMPDAAPRPSATMGAR